MGKPIIKNDNYDTAIQDLTKAIDLGTPDNGYIAPLVYHLRAKAYFGKGDIDAAKKDLDVVVSF